MDWNDFIDNVLRTNNKLDDSVISLKEGNFIYGIPPIIKVSLNLLNQFFSHGEKRIVFVFPDKEQNAFLLAIIKTITDIFEGTAGSYYDPYSFKKGQKLKFRNCVVEFDRIDVTDGNTMLWVRDADCVVGVPIELAPYFQLTDTKRRLSKDSDYELTKKEINLEYQTSYGKSDPNPILSDLKTHLKKSVFGVAPLGKTKEKLEQVHINSSSIQSLLLIGQADFEGNIKTIGDGQLSGVPAIVLTSNLYSVSAAINKGAEVSLLMIDVTNANSIQAQLDDLDKLLNSDFPIICTTDTSNSFDLDLLEQRGFSIWRWDEESISDSLYQSSNEVFDKKLSNCRNQNIIYYTIEEIKISTSLLTLFKNRNEVEESLNSNAIAAYGKLLRAAYYVMDNVSDYQEPELSMFSSLVNNSMDLISGEKNYLDPKLFASLMASAKDLSTFISADFVLPKIEAIKEIILSRKYRHICIIIPDRIPKDTSSKYWESFCLEHKTKTRVVVMNKSEYCNMQSVACNLVVVCGWYGQKAMKDILFCYNSQNYKIIMYKCEQRWCASHSRNWHQSLHVNRKKEIVSRILPDVQIRCSASYVSPVVPEDDVGSVWDPDVLLQEINYGPYRSPSVSDKNSEPVVAIPLNFVGGDFAFFKEKHKAICVTNIIMQKSNEINVIFAEELKVGDYIVIREAQRDIIRELADIILTNNGKQELINLSQKWKESIKVEICFSDFDQIYNKLVRVGCTKNRYTIKQWINNDDIIAPSSKDDLVYISKACDDDILLEKIDDIYEASREVKSAHVKAGQYLSKLLKQQIAEKMTQMGPIDPYNIWEAIPLYLPQIGNVEILKIIDIGSEILVDPSNTNRLISEQ